MADFTHAVAWREGSGEIFSGRLTAAASHLELEGPGARTPLSADEIAAVHIGREIGERVRGRPALVLERQAGPSVHVAPLLGVGLTHELADQLQRWVLARPATSPLRVLVAGGGIAAAETVLALRHHARERVAITLLSPTRTASYRPLDVLEPLGGAPQGFDLAELARACAADLRVDSLAAVAAAEHAVRTQRGARLEYDALVVATGAKPENAVDGALMLGSPVFGAEFARALAAVETGAARRIVFVVPEGHVWPLPLYELALLTAERLRGRARLTLVTAERAPLAVFGAEAGAAVTTRLVGAGVEVLARVRVSRVGDGMLELPSGAGLAADCVVALPRLVGLPVPGLPGDESGFFPTDPYGHVEGAEHVYAAGDATPLPVKHGGLAAQQADSVAAGIAALAGAPVRPPPFRPVLHGLLLTGGRPLYLRAESGRRRDAAPVVSEDALWWPPAKVAARHLAPYLAARASAAGGSSA